MEYSQKYTLVQFFQQVDIDEVFHMTEWPPHVTLADIFAVDITDQLIADLETYLDTWSYALTCVGNEGTLGTANVWLLKNTPELQAIHDRVVDILEKHGAVFDNPEFTRDGFIPRITKQADFDIKIGDKVSIDVVALVDMFPDQDWQNRKVLKRFAPELK